MNWQYKITSFFLLTIYFLLPNNSFAQLKTYSIEEIANLQEKQEKITAIFIHTDWCKYCAALKNTTLKNKEVIQSLNDEFYFIDFNAESKEKIFFINRLFQYKPSGNKTGIHELALELASINGKTSFPTFCFLNSKNEIIFQVSNYLSPNEFLNIIKKLK